MIWLLQVVCLVVVFLEVSGGPLPTNLEDNKNYESEIEVGNEEVVFYYESFSAPVTIYFELIDNGTLPGTYLVTINGESGASKSCKNGQCKQDVTLEIECDNKENCAGLDCDFENEFNCDIRDQPDRQWRFILTVECQKGNCLKEVDFEIKLKRSPGAGYGWMMLDITIYTTILLFVDIMALMFCMCYIFGGVCCFLPLLSAGCVFDRDVNGTIIGIVTFFCCGAPICCTLGLAIVLPNFALFFFIWVVVVFILSIIYWAQYCCG